MSEEIKEILDRMQELVEHKYDKEIHTYNLFDDIQDLLNYITNLQQKIEQLEKENKILKENAEHNDKVVDKVNWENMLLKGKINKDFEEFNDKLNTFKWQENNFKEHSIHYYQLECLVEYLKSLKENNKDAC